VPRVPGYLLDAVIYLYPSKADALEGTRSGGTGFILGVPSEVLSDRPALYFVTNAHVAESSPVARLNLAGRTGFDALELTSGGWITHPDGDDIAIHPIDLDDMSPFLFSWISAKALLTESYCFARMMYGPGDDAFFIGRYGDLEGRDTNQPTVRFGELSRYYYGDDVMQQGRSRRQQSFLVEAHSLSGYSGSPVFVWRSAQVEEDTESYSGLSVQIYVKPECWLLGIDWGHHSSNEKVRDGDDKPVKDFSVRTNTGIMMVVPAWKLRDLLDLEELVKDRERRDEEFRKQIERGPSGVLDSLSPEPTDEPFTREEFMDRLKKVTAKADPADPD
jgi:hypothetical protein